MDFDQARKTYDDLHSKYQAGEIDGEEFESSVNELVISDPAGTMWQIGVRSGRWYRFDGKEWVEDAPPLQEGHEMPRWKEPAAQQAAYPPTPHAAAPQYMAAPPKPKRKWGRTFFILGMIVVGLSAICCLVLFGYAYMTGQLQF